MKGGETKKKGEITIWDYVILAMTEREKKCCCCSHSLLLGWEKRKKKE